MLGFLFEFRSPMIDVISTTSRLNEVVGQIVIAGNGIYIEKISIVQCVRVSENILTF